jgi:hypothetical protein
MSLLGRDGGVQAPIIAGEVIDGCTNCQITGGLRFNTTCNFPA